MRFITAILVLGVAFAQAPTPVASTVVTGITSSAKIIDNRSKPYRSNWLHTFCATGTGTWTAQIQYADTTPTTWTNFVDPASVVSNASTVCSGIGTGYHDFIRFNISGSASVSYYGSKMLYIPTVAGGATGPQGPPGPAGSGAGAAGSGALTFTGLQDGTCSEGTFPLTGATAGSALIFAPPAGLAAGIQAVARVSSANTVSVRACNMSGAPQTFTATWSARLASYTLSVTGSPSWSAILDGNCGIQTMTLTGATAGDPVALGPPSALAAGLFPVASVSADNTIQLNVCNFSGATATPSGAWTVQVAK